MNDKEKRVTIKEVAKHAGVSTATVSRVVNKSGFVTSELVSKVLKSMKKLNYYPNRTARSLKKQKNSTIAYLIPDINNPIFAKVARGIQDAMEKISYDVFLYNTDFSDKRLLRHVMSILENNPQGMILSAWHSEKVKEAVSLVRELGIPIVVVHSPRDIHELDMITVEDSKGAYECIYRLIRMGHTRILSLGVKNSVTSALREEGYRTALKECIGKVDEELIIRVKNFSSNAAFTVSNQLFRNSLHFTAVFTHSDSLAIGVMEATYAAGLKIPEELSIVGFDGAYAFCTVPKLSTMTIPNYEMGKKAAEILLRRIDNVVDQPPPLREFVMPIFTEQHSTRRIF